MCEHAYDFPAYMCHNLSVRGRESAGAPVRRRSSLLVDPSGGINPVLGSQINSWSIKGKEHSLHSKRLSQHEVKTSAYYYYYIFVKHLYVFSIISQISNFVHFCLSRFVKTRIKKVFVFCEAACPKHHSIITTAHFTPA